MRGGGGGGGGADGGRSKYNVTLGVNVNNIFNHTKPTSFSGVLSSPFFGIGNRPTQARRIDASLRFSF